MSRRVLVVVEGQTEFSVLNSTLAPHLGSLGVYLYPKVVGRPGHKGGVRRGFESVANEILNLFRQEPSAIVSTFFDFYGMPDDWPGVELARDARKVGCSSSGAAAMVEVAWQQAVSAKTATLGFQTTFVPYIQMHELEALLFSSPRDMAEGFLQPRLEDSFRKIVAECGGCEEINDRPEHAPSRRIEGLFPSYRKGRDKNKSPGRRPHAPVIAERIGVAGIREACPHFNQWVTTLEQFGTSSS